MDVRFSTRVGIDATLAWQDHMSLGDGFNAYDMQSAPSPFLKLEAQPLGELSAYRRIDFQYQFIRNNDDFKKALKKSIDISAPVSHVSASTFVKFMKDVECNSTYITTLIQCTITGPPQLCLPESVLSQSGREHLMKDGVDSFLRRYGSHFIAGKICQSTFSIMLTHIAANSEDAKQLVKTLNTNYAKLVDETSLAGFKDTLKKSQVETRVRLAMTGSTFTNIKIFLTLDDIVPIFDAWKASLQSEPYVAILKHYSLVIDGIPRPISKWEIYTDLVEAYEDLLLLQMKVRSSYKTKELKILLDGIESLERQVVKMRQSDINWRSDLQQWKDEYNQRETEFTSLSHPIERRRELLQMVHDSQSTISWPKNKKMYPGQITEFRTGITNPKLFEPFSSEIAVFRWWFSKDRKPDTNGIVQKEVCEFGVHGDRIIIGIEAISEREDQHNNGWFTLRSGGVGEPYVDLFFETSHWRASEWSVQIWHVDRKLYSVQGQ